MVGRNVKLTCRKRKFFYQYYRIPRKSHRAAKLPVDRRCLTQNGISEVIESNSTLETTRNVFLITMIEHWLNINSQFDRFTPVYPTINKSAAFKQVMEWVLFFGWYFVCLSLCDILFDLFTEAVNEFISVSFFEAHGSFTFSRKTSKIVEINKCIFYKYQEGKKPPDKI